MTTSDVYLNREGNELLLGNGRVELALDAGNGHFRNIRCLDTGIEHKRPEDGVWPFGVTVGTLEQPQQMRAEVRADTAQEMVYRFEQVPDQGMRLRLDYPMLVDDTTGQATGIGLGVEVELAPDQICFVIRTEVANNGPLWLTRFYGGLGELLTGDESRAEELVWVPCRGGASHEEFSRTTLGLPTYGWGWADYSGERGGIGIAYINHQGIQWCFDWAKTPTGLSTSWRLFDLNGYWHFESMMNEEQRVLLIQPLEPGNAFLTDEWLLIPHAGDWHRTADVYREHFEKRFDGDRLAWNALPEKARELDVYAGFWVAENEIGNRYPRQVYNHLDTVAPQIEELLHATEADPAHVGVGLTWFQAQVGRYPDFFPVYKPAGGEAAWNSMMPALRALDVSFVGGYTHLSYQHPASRHYLPEADVQGTVPWVNPTVGDRACVDNAAWADLWRDELIPAYREHGLNMVFMDEGHFPWGTCAAGGPAHLHGPSAVGILTGNTRGMLQLHRLFHEGLGSESLIMTEGSGDVTGRWADLHFAYPWDPAIAYTLPARRYGRVLAALHAGNPPQVRAEALPGLRSEINALIAAGEFAIVGLQQDQPLEGLEELRRYCQIRQRLRTALAPGYPHGFRHTLGLEVSDPRLVATAFADADGITVVYHATEEVSTELRLNPEALGLPHCAPQILPLALDEGGLDFWLTRRPRPGN